MPLNLLIKLQKQNLKWQISWAKLFLRIKIGEELKEIVKQDNRK